MRKGISCLMKSDGNKLIGKRKVSFDLAVYDVFKVKTRQNLLRDDGIVAVH
jgi:hypothetical protein